MTPRPPPLERLRVFEAAARHLSFKEAAVELCITPSAVSHQIKALEQHLGFGLFKRHNRGLSLTESGESYLTVVSTALTALRRGHERVVQLHGQSPLRIHTVSFLAELMIPWLDSFRKNHPTIQLRIETGLDAVDLSRDPVDLALRLGDGKWPELHCEKLLALSFAPVCAPALMKSNPMRKPADITRHTLIDFINYPEAWRLWLRQQAIAPENIEKRLLLDNYSAMLLAAEQGLGLTIGMFPLVLPRLRAGRLVAPFKDPIPSHWGTYLVCRPGDQQRPDIVAFRRWLKRQIQRYIT